MACGGAMPAGMDSAAVDSTTTEIVQRLGAKLIGQVSCKDMEQLLDENFKLNDHIWSVMQQAWDCAVRLDCQLAETEKPSQEQNSCMRALAQDRTQLSLQKAEVDSEILRAKLMVQEACAGASLIKVALLSAVFEACLRLREDATWFGERIEAVVSEARQRLKSFGEAPTSGASTLFASHGVTKRWRESFVETHDANRTLLRALRQTDCETVLPHSAVEETCDQNWCFILELVGMLEKVIVQEQDKNVREASGTITRRAGEQAQQDNEDANQEPKRVHNGGDKEVGGADSEGDLVTEARGLRQQLEERLPALLDLKRQTLEATACGIALDMTPVEQEVARAQAAVMATWRFLTNRGIDLTDIVPTKFVEEMLPHPAAFRSAVSLVNDDDGNSLSTTYPAIVRVLTYSLALCAPMLPFMASSCDDHKDERLSRFAATLDRFDLLLLQEVSGVFSNRRERLIAAAEEAGFQEANVLSSNIDIWPTYLFDSGLVILSRLPMVEKARFRYKPGFHLDRLWARGALYAKLRLGSDGPFLHVCTTQLQSSISEEHHTQACAVRRGQLSCLARDLKEVMQSSDGGSRVWPLLLGGNFNINGRRSSTDSTHSAEYCCLVDLLQDELGPLRDLLYDSCGSHPVTYADMRLTGKGEVPAERMLTAKLAQENPFFQRQRLDYLLFFPQPTEATALAGGAERIVPATCGIEKFLVDRARDIGAPITQLSDHFAVEASLTVINPSASAPSRPEESNGSGSGNDLE